MLGKSAFEVLLKYMFNLVAAEKNIIVMGSTHSFSAFYFSLLLPAPGYAVPMSTISVQSLSLGLYSVVS